MAASKETLVVTGVVLWGVLMIFIISIGIKNLLPAKVVLTEEQRNKCNAAFNTTLPLAENLHFEFFDFSPNTTTPDELKYNLEQTNKQVNKLQALIGCYFDKVN